MEFHVPQDRIRIFIPGFDSDPCVQFSEMKCLQNPCPMHASVGEIWDCLRIFDDVCIIPRVLCVHCIFSRYFMRSIIQYQDFRRSTLVLLFCLHMLALVATSLCLFHVESGKPFWAFLAPKPFTSLQPSYLTPGYLIAKGWRPNWSPCHGERTDRAFVWRIGGGHDMGLRSFFNVGQLPSTSKKTVWFKWFL